jgi:hypothetical protein
VAVVPVPVNLPSAAPLPRRKPPVPRVPPPAPPTASQSSPALPWLQSVTPPPATPGAAQAPTQLPAPGGTPGAAAVPPQGQVTPDAQPVSPPPAQQPAHRFDPFVEETGN